MVTYSLPFMLLFHFVLLCLFILAKGINEFTGGKRKWVSFAGCGIALFSMILIFVIVFFPFPVDLDEIRFNKENQYGQTNNFIPFRSIVMCVKAFFDGQYSVFVYQVIGNIILFMPFGFGIHILFFYNEKKLAKTFFIVVVTGLSIEIMQGVYSMLLGYTYRSTDIDDLFLNIAGGMLVFIVVKLLHCYLFPKKRDTSI